MQLLSGAKKYCWFAFELHLQPDNRFSWVALTQTCAFSRVGQSFWNKASVDGSFSWIHSKNIVIHRKILVEIWWVIIIRSEVTVVSKLKQMRLKVSPQMTCHSVSSFGFLLVGSDQLYSSRSCWLWPAPENSQSGPEVSQWFWRSQQKGICKYFIWSATCQMFDGLCIVIWSNVM